MTARDHARALLESVADSHDDLTRAVAGVGWALLTDPYPRREADNTAATGHQRPANGPRSAEQAEGGYLDGGPAGRPTEPFRGCDEFYHRRRVANCPHCQKLDTKEDH